MPEDASPSRPPRRRGVRSVVALLVPLLLIFSGAPVRAQPSTIEDLVGTLAEVRDQGTGEASSESEGSAHVGATDATERRKDASEPSPENRDEDRAENLSSLIGVRLQGDVDTVFFAHEPFGFDASTFDALARDGIGAFTWARAEVEALRGRPLGSALFSLLPIAVLLLVMIAAAFADVRTRRHTETLASRVSQERDLPRWRAGLERSALRGAGRLGIPLILWLLSYVPIQGLFGSAPWTQALSDVIGLFLVYRTAVVVLEESLNGDFFPVPDDIGKRLRSNGVFSLRLVWFFGALLLFVVDVQYRDDVAALARTLFRTSITLLSLRVLWLREPILHLLPQEGSERWLRLRAVMERAFRTFVVVSFLLLTLWTLGFTRAASTILVRSYAIVALVMLAALVMRWFEERVSSLRSSDMSSVAAALVSQVDGFARVFGYLAFGYAALAILGLGAPLVELLQALSFTVGETPISLFKVLKGIAIIGIAVLFSRVLRVVLESLVYPAVGIEVGAGYALSTAMHYFLLISAAGAALITIGINLAAMSVFAGALGVGIGFGLQDIARNLISGFILLFGRSVEKGDWITVNDRSFGRVETVGARSVLLRTPDNFDLVIPSSELVNSTIINWTHDDPHVRVHAKVGTSYSADPRTVREALLEAARRSPHAIKVRPPSVWLINFGDNAIEFELLIWVDVTRVTPEQVRGELLFEIWDVFVERGIDIPFPQRALHIRTIGDMGGAEVAAAFRMRTADTTKPPAARPRTSDDVLPTPRSTGTETPPSAGAATPTVVPEVDEASMRGAIRLDTDDPPDADSDPT